MTPGTRASSVRAALRATGNALLECRSRWLRASPLFLMGVTTGCAGQLFTLHDTGAPTPDHVVATNSARVEVTREPFSYRVLDGTGRPVLSTLGDDAAGGFAPVAWTDGKVRYANVLSPGYTSFAAALEPWHARFRVEHAMADGRDLVVELREENDAEAPPLFLRFQVRDRAVRVSAQVLGRTPRAWSVGFRSPPDEAFLGFGERFNRTNQRGVKVFNWVEEGGVGIGEGTKAGAKNPWPNGEAMTSYPVPFFISSQRYGFWLDTTYRSEFDLVASRNDAWRVWHVGDRLDFEVYVPSDGRRWPYQLIDEFTEATGRPMVPPPWAFGPRRRVSRGASAMDGSEIVAMRQQDLAVTSIDDATHFFPDAAHHGKEEQLREWVADATALGYRVNGYYNSLVKDGAGSRFSQLLDDDQRKRFFLRREDGSSPDLWIFTGGRVVRTHVVDFTRHDAKRWYQQTFEWATSLGYSGWMYDFGEYVPWDVAAANGMSGEQLHNLYPVLYAQTVFEAMQRGPRKNDWLAFMRSGYTGSSSWVPMVWSGDPAASFEDADGLPSMIRAGVNLGISGVPNWGGDIGGYHCLADGAAAADEELLIRWIQQGALSPNMQDQNACVGVPNKKRKATIWKSERTLAAYRHFARLHTRLFPYLYTLSRDAGRSGAPLMRHPFLEHPDDARLVSVDDAYYLGPALFVAPVVERGARTKRVLLPNALYVDWSDPRIVEGGREVVLDAPLEKLPMLLRAGTLIALLDDSIDTLTNEDLADVVGPMDVAANYDVVGVLTRGLPASLTLYDGTQLRAVYSGDLGANALGKRVTSEAELETCERCYLLETLSPRLRRLRIDLDAGRVSAGGLVLEAESKRRQRWELFLVD